MKSSANDPSQQYLVLLESLEPNEVYAPSTIINSQSDHVLFADLNQEALLKMRFRARLALSRLAEKHAFPTAGDQELKIKGQASIPAWFGWRWKELLKGGQ